MPPSPIHALASHLALTEADADFAGWAWGFGALPREAYCSVGSVVVRLAAAAFQELAPPDEFGRDLHQAVPIESALDSLQQTAGGLEQRKALRELEDHISRFAFYVDEASGTAEVVEQRERCLAAGKAVLLALQAHCWTPDDVSQELDPGERAAQTSDGPALQLSQCLSFACLATGLVRGELVAKLSVLTAGDSPLNIEP
jgi:hypothetical protein